MNAPAGWYLDPAGEPDVYRYWDGSSWLATTAPAPNAPPPPVHPPPGSPAGGVPPAAPRARRMGWILGAMALALVVAVVIAMVVIRRTPTRPGDPPPASSSSAVVCPKASTPTATPPAKTGNRVTSGRLSYPRLGAPFSAPLYDSWVPFGRDVQDQQATVESEGSRPTWVASVLIARLLAGDGFYGPQQGAAVVVTCITGLFYGEAAVGRADVKSQAMTVDGHDAWLVESHLTFDLSAQGIQTKGELLVVVVVDTGDGEAGLFYASIPDLSPQFEPPARDALARLEVS